MDADVGSLRLTGGDSGCIAIVLFLYAFLLQGVGLAMPGAEHSVNDKSEPLYLFLGHKKTVDLQDIVSSALIEAVGLYRLCIILLVQCCGPQYKVVGRYVYGFWRTVLAFSGTYALDCHCA